MNDEMSAKKQDWIYQIRGLGILAVVVCHQQGLLHWSEKIQLLSLYSVTTLIFLMGVSKAFSFRSHFASNSQPPGILVYSLSSMVPTLCAYIAASFVYAYNLLDALDFNALFASILSFSACSAFYFIRHYILLTLWAPLLFCAVKWGLNAKHGHREVRLVLIYGIIWLVGYESIGRLDIFTQSYLFVYSVGLLVGQLDCRRPSKHWLVPALLLLVVGLISTKNFYWARISGVLDYSGGINVLAPKLQMNPPNISIILYSFGIISVSYLFFRLTEDSRNRINKVVQFVFKILGKYSLDIFLWHLYIQRSLNRWFVNMNIGVPKACIYYGGMLLIPVAGRQMYRRGKKKMSELLKA